MGELSLPWLPSFGLGHSFYQLSRIHSNFSVNREKFFDSVNLSRLICQRSDDYDDSNLSEPSYIYATKFCPREGSEDLLALANEDGVIILQNTSKSGSDSFVTHFEAHNNAIFGLAWVPGSNESLISVSGDQTARLWDLSKFNSESQIEEVRVFRGSSRSVKCVEFLPDDKNVFAVGSRDNSIFIWDIRCPDETKAVNVIRNAHLVQSTANPKPLKRRRESLHNSPAVQQLSSSVTAITFQDSCTLVSASDLDGIIKIWDLRKSYDRYNGQPHPSFQIPYPGNTALKGYSALLFDSSRTKLFASCTDHHIYKFDCASYSSKPSTSYTGFTNNSRYFSKISLSPDGTYLISGSVDKSAKIWNVGPRGPNTPIARLEGHDSEVTCVEWCPRGLKVVTCSDDMKHRTWRQVDTPERVDKTLIIGEAVLESEIEYFVPQKSKSDLVVRVCHDEPELFCAKHRMFDENDQNVENKFASIRLSEKSSSRLGPARIAFPCSPKKLIISPRKTSPRKLIFSPRKLEIYNSPTSNLPNLVLDQLKHPERSSPQGSRQQARKRLDWLTSLSRQKKETEVLKSSRSPQSAKKVRSKRKLEH